MSGVSDFDASMGRLEELLHRAERSLSPEALELTRELVQAVLAVHRGGLEQMLAGLREREGDGYDEALRALCRRPALSGLLLLHDLHPEVSVDSPSAMAQAEAAEPLRLIPAEDLFRERSRS